MSCLSTHASLFVVTHVVSGVGVASDWTTVITSDDDGTGTGNAPGSETGVTFILEVGHQYTVSTTGGVDGYTETLTGFSEIPVTARGTCYTCMIQESIGSDVEIGGNEPLRLIGGGRSVLLINAPAGGMLYGEDISETYSLGAIDTLDGSGLLQRFLYGMFLTVVAQTVSLTNADASDVVPAVSLGGDGLVHLGADRGVVADVSLQSPLLIGTPTTFAGLGSAVDGTMKYCADCLVGSNPASGSSTGAWAKRLNGIWRCD